MILRHTRAEIIADLRQWLKTYTDDYAQNLKPPELVNVLEAKLRELLEKLTEVR